MLGFHAPKLLSKHERRCLKLVDGPAEDESAVWALLVLPAGHTRTRITITVCLCMTDAHAGGTGCLYVLVKLVQRALCGGSCTSNGRPMPTREVQSRLVESRGLSVSTDLVASTLDACSYSVAIPVHINPPLHL